MSTDREYEHREVMSFLNQVNALEKLPLSERKENAVDFYQAMLTPGEQKRLDVAIQRQIKRSSERDRSRTRRRAPVSRRRVAKRRTRR